MQKLAPAEAECFVPQLKLADVKDKMMMAFNSGRFSKNHFSSTNPLICMGGGTAT
ncbi:MAG: hypothetical protein HDR35_07440 [Treponema sp.]|nr:hypothetical protein [Treponema sp.]